MENEIEGLINIATGDRNADWIKLADPEAARKDQIACDLALEMYKKQKEVEMAEKISNRAWSTFTEADYTPEQWYEACLIKPVRAEYKAKYQAKLPVREPDGTLNRNGVHAAAAALAGARGGVDATPEEKRQAARKLLRLYQILGEEAPDSIRRMAGM